MAPAAGKRLISLLLCDHLESAGGVSMLIHVVLGIRIEDYTEEGGGLSEALFKNPLVDVGGGMPQTLKSMHCSCLGTEFGS